MPQAQRHRPAAQQQRLSSDQRLAQDQSSLTRQQSVQTVKQLVETSIGCFTYLRALFPEGNFEDSVVPGGKTQLDEDGNPRRARGDGSIKVKKLIKGWSKEADQLLAYLEEGVTEALERNFLDSLILALSIDAQKTSDVVEAYTFNFTYKTIEGTNEKVPVMDIADKLKGVSIWKTPENNAVMPTARDIRSSVQAIVRSLITLTQSLTDLPRRRYLTLKLIYNEDCPSDYEPKDFRAADPDKDRYTFSTKGLNQKADEIKIGTLDTGHHGMSIHIASIAHLLPAAADVDHVMTAEEEQKVLAADAAQRNVLWDAEQQTRKDEDMNSDDADAPGSSNEAELSEAQKEQARLMRERDKRLGLARKEVGEPIGLRMSSGRIAPIPPSAVKEAAERLKQSKQGGPSAALEHAQDETMTNLETFVARAVRREWNDDGSTNAALANNLSSPGYTQSIDGTVPMSSAVGVRPNGERESSPVFSNEPVTPQRLAPPLTPEHTPTPMRHPAHRTEAEASHSVSEDTVMEGVEAHESQTQSQSQPQQPHAHASPGSMAVDSEDPIESASPPPPPSSQWPATRSQRSTRRSMSRSESLDPVQSSGMSTRSKRSASLIKQVKREPEPLTKGKKKEASSDIHCDCGDHVEDGLMIQCEVCKHWQHGACYGYTAEGEVSNDFRCYADQIERDKSMQTHEQDGVRDDVIADLGSLALMRRALFKLYEDGWSSMPSFQSRLGCALRDAKAMHGRCVVEGFLVAPTDEKGKRADKKRKTGPKETQVVKTLDVVRRKKQVYFSPGKGAEAEIKARWIKACNKEQAEDVEMEPAEESMTQDDSMMPPVPYSPPRAPSAPSAHAPAFPSAGADARNLTSPFFNAAQASHEGIDPALLTNSQHGTSGNAVAGPSGARPTDEDGAPPGSLLQPQSQQQQQGGDNSQVQLPRVIRKKQSLSMSAIELDDMEY